MKTNIIKTNYVIRDREAGNIIEEFNTLQEALKELKNFELSDKKEGIFEVNFYEVAIINESSQY